MNLIRKLPRIRYLPLGGKAIRNVDTFWINNEEYTYTVFSIGRYILFSISTEDFGMNTLF